MDFQDTPLEIVQRMQDQLISFSTNGGFDGGNDAFQALRKTILDLPEVEETIPAFLKRHRDLSSYWQFIKHKFAKYSERREFLWDSFRTLLEKLEADESHPSSRPIDAILTSFDENGVRAVWRKAMDRRNADPEGLSPRPALWSKVHARICWMNYGFPIPPTPIRPSSGRCVPNN